MKRVKGHRYLYTREGAYYFRRSIPLDLRLAFGGKTEVIVSFGGRSLAEARHLLHEQVEAFEQTAAKARGSADPTQATLARTAIRRVKPTREELERAVRLWRRERLDRMAIEVGGIAPAEAIDRAADLSREAMIAGERLKVATGFNLSKNQTAWFAEDIIERNGWELEEGGHEWTTLLRLLDRGLQDVAKRTLSELNGAPLPLPDGVFSPEHDAQDEAWRKEQISKSKVAVPITGLLDRYKVAHKISPATDKTWRRVFPKLKDFLGHDDAHAVTTEDLIRWRDHLLTEVDAKGAQRSLRTVRDCYLAALKAVFKDAAENRVLASDPAKGVKLKKVKTVRLRNPGFTDEEALTILRGTLTAPPSRMSEEMALARRWVPWICAYTGARVNEITQLRAQDIRTEKDLCIIRITPEAGSVKNNTAREVPLHQHVVDQGFLEMLRGRSGPLFYNQQRHRGGKDGNPQYKKVGERLAAWVRELGVTDESILPNHAWRHRFKTLTRKYKLHLHVANAIQGHTNGTESEEYGEVDLETMSEAINSLPRYGVENRD